MMDSLRLGLGPLLVPLPGPLWKRKVESQAAGAEHLLAQLPEDHRRVRRFAVADDSANSHLGLVSRCRRYLVSHGGGTG